MFARRTATTGGGPVVIVTPEYRRTHLVGATFSNAFGNLTVRGEVAAFLGRTLSVSNPADSPGKPLPVTSPKPTLANAFQRYSGEIARAILLAPMLLDF